MEATAETLDDEAVEDTADLAKRYIDELERCERWLGEWWRRGDQVVKRYRDERNQQSTAHKANLLWSNVGTLQPSLYARTPVPEVSRRFKDADPIGRQASELLERCASYGLDEGWFDDVMRQMVKDVLLPGLGVAWARYEAEFETIIDPMSGLEMQNKANERVVFDYVHWRDFRYSPARTWSEVWWVARPAFMTREELVERFGMELGNKITLDHAPKEEIRDDERPDDTFKKATIWELWDKKSGTRVMLHRQHKDGVLEVVEAPLKLHGFFPCPKPLLATLTTDKLIPIPDYCFYQDQLDEIDELTGRIAKLTDGLRLVGFYGGSEKEVMQRAFDGIDDGPRLVPVATEVMWESKGGVSGLIQWMPLRDVVQALQGCYEARERAKEMMYEITGISDIIRGVTQASETATAQQIKSNWSGIRIKDRQDDVQRFARDLIRLKCEIVAEMFDPETAMKMANLPEVDQKVFMLLRDDQLRSFRIDIETDSTIQPDEEAEKQARTEFLQAVGGFLQQSMPVVQAVPQMAPMLSEMMLFGARGFRAGRQLEDIIEQTMQQVSQQSQQPPPPDPRIEMERQKIEMEQQKAQAQLQIEQQKAQSAMQVEQARAAAGVETDRLRLQLEREKMQAQHELEIQRINLEHKRRLTELGIDAEIKRAGAAMDAAQMSAEEVGDDGGETPVESRGSSQMAGAIQAMADALAMFGRQMDVFGDKVQAMGQAQAAPKRVTRDEQGRVTGVETIQ